MGGRVHDAVVVGGGPAGSTLALLLAREGLDVLLLDRVPFPREKACGDCLSAEATRLLGRLGLLPAVLALGPARLRGWRICGPVNACFSASFSELGDPDPAVHSALAVRRRELDAALLAAATAAGATVRTGWQVTDVLRDGDWIRGVSARVAGGGEAEVRARFTVGADGLRSRVARRLGAVARRPRIRKVSLTAHVHGLRPNDGFGEMHSGAGVCVGLAPVTATGDCWNVTVVADADRFGPQLKRSHAFFRTALGMLPSLAGLAIEPAELLASGPFDVPMRRITFPGAALVGDAAGYFDPFTGQGIYQAMAGAELLARIVAPLLRRAARTSPTAHELRPYADAHRRMTGGTRRVQQLVHHVLDRPGLAELAIAGLARRPRAAAALLAVTGDLRPAGSLLSPGLAISLLLPRPVDPAGARHRRPQVP